MVTSMVLDEQFSPAPPVPATSAGLVLGAARTPLAQPADPLLATPAPSPLSASTTGDDTAGRPVYAPVGDPLETEPATNPGDRIHVVHNGDTLERLAERYLSDGARALELFDLNRDVLENPHLLPIGVELRVPGAAANAD
jgi:nucleoid-associated protein YgaU